ncbi:hybrid sensor histidine kinase/response regulator [Halogeometricum limi]|uniref:histidine kinase n=1 Tax=Halogeometricum limi TaxID=555875 RepID=A0A1I6IRR9_9EURY|nr:ATP-binding protein [Halogeometricum limi]SFR69427.1 PAS domain S-box-containing protein [Halogeometricum limi]
MTTLREEISVLYVDADAERSSSVAAFLEGENVGHDFSVEAVADPRDALQVLGDAPSTADCILCGDEFPESDPLDFLRLVRSGRSSLPFVLFAGDDSADAARDAFRAGATDYVPESTDADRFAVLATRVADAVSRECAPTTDASADGPDSTEMAETAVYALDETGRFVFVDDAFVEMVGYDRETVLGNHLSALVPSDERQTRDELTAFFEADAETTRFETNVCRADGDSLPCVGRVSVRPFDADEPHAVGTLSNVADRQRARRDASRERLTDVVLDTSTMLMSAEIDEVDAKIHWTIQSLGDFADVDAVAVYSYDVDTDTLQKTHEWTTGDVPSRPTVVGGEDCEWFIDRLCRFEDVTVERPRSSSTPDATSLSLPEGGSYLALPMVSNWSLVGALTFVSATSRPWTETEVSLFDTTADMLSYTLERQRRERRLRQQNDRLEEFASVVSHDLRNPLNVVDGFVDLARETGDVSHLDRAAEALERMDTLVNDVLQLARQGRTVGETSSVDVRGVAERAWAAVDTGDATLELGEHLATISADASRLTQVIENLVRNAVDHGGDDVRISIGSLPDRSGFYVEDDGPGIPKDERATVFEQGHTTARSGSGFGLSIVESIVEAHGWDVVATEGTDGGARFEIVTAPRAQTFDPNRP